jgi:hypothetical protein
MTLLTTTNDISYAGLAGNDTFAYTFRVDNQTDMNVSLDSVPVAQGDFTMTGLGDSVGGTVVLNTPLVVDAQVVLERIVPITQETDYVPFDAFPAETHENALDKLTMIGQQNSSAVVRSLRFPAGDTAEVELPDVATRGSKYLFFDPNGDANVIEAEPDPFSVLTINVASDTVNMLRVDTQTLGTQNPTLQFLNINGADGVMQLTDQGKIPNGLLNFIGLQARGSFRGDDLCDKPGDNPGDCLAPDTRNPSQRSIELDPTFQNGDYFIITMQAPEVSGTMDLFVAVGDVATQVVTVQPRDGVIFLAEVLDPNDPGIILVQRGWYFVEKLVETGDANFITYDPAGNSYVLGTNVQVALDSVDADLLARDAYYLTNKNTGRFGLIVPGGDVNTISETGFYSGVNGELNLPGANNFSIFHHQFDANAAAQIAITDDTTATTFVRTFTAGAWAAWVEIANVDFVNTFLPLAGGTVTGTLFISSTAPTIDFNETDAALDEKVWQLLAESGQLVIRAYSDDRSGFSTVLSFGRTGIVPVNMIVRAVLQVGDGITGGDVLARRTPGADVSYNLLRDTGETAGRFLLRADDTVVIESLDNLGGVLTTLTLTSDGNVRVNAPLPINDADLANKGYVDTEILATIPHLIIGQVAIDSTVVVGTGFTSTTVAGGTATVTFDVPQVDLNYVVMATPQNSSTSTHANVINKDVNGFDVVIGDNGGAVNSDFAFSVQR